MKPVTDTIYVDPKNLDSWFIPPRELTSDPRFIKHVECEGARFHVVWWDTEGTHCSEKDCTLNKR